MTAKISQLFKLDEEWSAFGLLVLAFAGFIILTAMIGFNLWVYTVVAVLGLILSYFQPRAGLLAILSLLMIFEKSFALQTVIVGWSEYKFYLVDILLLAVLSRWLVDWSATRVIWRWRRSDGFLIIFWIFILIYGAIGYWDTWSDLGSGALIVSAIKNYLFYPLIMIAAASYFTKPLDWRRLFIVLLFNSLILLGFTAFGLYTGQGLWVEATPLSTEGVRLLSFNHAFYLSLIFLTVASVVLFYRRQKWSEVLVWCLPLFALGIMSSLMRHLWLALAVSFLVMYFLVAVWQRQLWRDLIYRYLLVAATVVSIVLLSVSLAPWSAWHVTVADATRGVSQRLLTATDSSDDSSVAWREVLWGQAWKNYQHQWLTGIGFGRKVFIDIDGYQDYVEVRNLHNSILALLIQLGLGGLLCFFGIYGSGLRQVWPHRTATADPFSSTISLALSAILIFQGIAFLFQPYLEANFLNIFFWFSLGLARSHYESRASQ